MKNYQNVMIGSVVWDPRSVSVHMVHDRDELVPKTRPGAHFHNFFGASRGIRTLISSLEGWHSSP